MNNGYQSIIIDPGNGGVDIGYYEGNHYEKDFNLKLSKYIYNRLKDLCFPVYMTRNDDYTMSNYDRYEYIDNITSEVGGKSLVLSIHIENEKSSGIDIIYSINSDDAINKDLYNKLNAITEVKTKTLPTDDSKDYYAIQRLAKDNMEVVVIEFGYDNLNDTNEEIKSYSDDIVNIIIDFFSDKDFVNCRIHVVEKGDYLYDLANRYNTTVDELIKINNLGTDSLDVGQVLKVPKTKENFYIVKRGDSLYSIAKKFNTTIDKIKDINNLTSNKLAVNQRLLIPI